jgi:hypothetical protein
MLAQMSVMPQLEGLVLVSVSPENGALIAERAAAFAHLKTFRMTLELPEANDVSHEPLIRRLRPKTNADLSIGNTTRADG